MYYVAMSASSNALETPIPKFSAVKEGGVASSPFPLLKSKDRQTSICLLGLNRSCSHPHCIYFVAMSASSNALETSIPEFSAVKGGDVASLHSPLIKSKRLANRYLFAVVKLLLFASPPHLFSWNGRFQRQARSINGLIYSCTRGRRCLVALSALKK